jgi:tetratricopeptide (TPR) repeat protein
MRTCIKLIAAGLMILISNNIVLGMIIPSVEEEREYVRKGQKEWEIQRALSEKLISWLSDANGPAGEECDRLVDSLLALPEPSIKAYFVAAQVTYIRGKPQVAISILEDLISKHSNKPAEVMQFPVSIVARFWIGTIARHSGDMTKAKSVYETLLKYLRGREGENNLAMICNLYLAEIESKYMKRDDLALARLEAIKRIEKPAGHWGEQYEFYNRWAAYEHDRISKGRAQANQQLVWYREMMSTPPLAAAQLQLCGISGSLFAPPYPPDDERADASGKAFYDRIIKNTASDIDTSLVRLTFGSFYQEKGRRAEAEKIYTKAQKHYLEAEKYYSELFDDNSFFSPIGGIYLAQCKKAQDKTVEAEGILEKVGAKYPGYESAVTELKESWKKEGESKK